MCEHSNALDNRNNRPRLVQAREQLTFDDQSAQSVGHKHDEQRMKLFTITFLVIAVAWLAGTVVRLENYRYANFVGLCASYDVTSPQKRIEREGCLENSETRTSWVWHLLYGLKVL